MCIVGGSALSLGGVDTFTILKNRLKVEKGGLLGGWVAETFLGKS